MDTLDKTSVIIRRDLYDELCNWLRKEGKEWREYPVYFDGENEKPTMLRIIPVTIAEQLIEKWLTEVWQPSLGADLNA